LFINNPNAANIITAPIIPAPVSAASILTIPTVGNPGPPPPNTSALPASTTNLLNTLNLLNATTELLDNTNGGTQNNSKKRSYGNMMFPEGTISTDNDAATTEAVSTSENDTAAVQATSSSSSNGKISDRCVIENLLVNLSILREYCGTEVSLTRKDRIGYIQSTSHFAPLFVTVSCTYSSIQHCCDYCKFEFFYDRNFSERDNSRFYYS
jgi:hypothetical protein